MPAVLSTRFIVVAGLLSLAYCAPVRDKRQSSGEGTITNTDGPPGASGALRGSPNLLGYNAGNPTDTETTVIPSDDYTLAPNQAADTDTGLYINLANAKNPQPIRGQPTNAPTDPGPRNQLLDIQNSDIFAPPGTDSGDSPQAKWPLGLSHNRHGLKGAGWARQQNVNQLPIATEMAGVDMRLEPYAYRELHWHSQAEWSYILNGTVRLNSMNEAGQSFVDDLVAGDLWFFPSGVPHSIQAGPEGCEFLLVFNSGSFSEDSTFLVSETFARNPKSVLAKDLRVDISALDNIPQDQLYIFPGTPYPTNISQSNVTGPAGVLPANSSYSYHFSQQQAYEVPGGSVKIADPLNFPTASTFSAALFTVKPGAMRELHWHSTSDEWSYFLSGQGRLTVFEAPSSSRTFDFQAGDVGYVPTPDAHYLENTGTEDLVYLKILQSSQYSDVSVAQWLGLTPKQIVKDHLGFSDDTLSRLPQVKPYILPGNPDLSTTNFTAEAE